MALDNLQKVEVTHNIDTNAQENSAAVNLGRTGLPERASVTIVVTEASAANFANGCRVIFEYTTDNGTTWHEGGVVDLKATASGLAKQVRSMPVGFQDIVPEQNAAGDIDWRVVSDIVATIASADDFTFTAYLGEHQGYAAVID